MIVGDFIYIMAATVVHTDLPISNKLTFPLGLVGNLFLTVKIMSGYGLSIDELMDLQNDDSVKTIHVSKVQLMWLDPHVSVKCNKLAMEAH